MLYQDSTDLTAEDRNALLARIRHHAQFSKRFVICHGTDTMIETGLFLLDVCKELDLVVVLCGSKIPESFKGKKIVQVQGVDPLWLSG